MTAVIIHISNQVAPVSKSEIIDDDEPTVAAVRQTAPVFASQAEFDEDAPTQDLKLPANFQTPVAAAQPEVQKNAAPSPVYETLQPIAPVEITPPAPEKIQETIPPVIRDEKTYRIDEKSGSGFFSKLVNALLLLIVGAILGIGVYYFAFASTVQPTAAPPITQMQTPDIPFSAFEKNRRNVDESPEKFISANAAQPQDAEDFFLLGRAYLLTGKYPESKTAFTEAKNRLAQAKDVNSRTMANEIAIAMAIINDPLAQRSFEKDISTGKTEPKTANTNANMANNVNSQK